jgi:flagellar biosynthesis protein FlhG
MSDQAESLRTMVGAGGLNPKARTQSQRLDSRERLNASPQNDSPTPEPAYGPRVVCITGAKGGVGTSNLVLNLGAALCRMSQRVLLVDANTKNADLAFLAGVSVRSRSLLPQSHAGAAPTGTSRLERLIDLIHRFECFEFAVERPKTPPIDSPAIDWVLIDAGRAAENSTSPLARFAHQMIVVSTPEPLALAHAHRALRQADQATNRTEHDRTMHIVLSQAASVFEGRECLSEFTDFCREHMNTHVIALGAIPTDTCVRHAVRSRVPYFMAHQHSAAARSVRKIARLLLREAKQSPVAPQCSPFFARGQL